MYMILKGKGALTGCGLHIYNHVSVLIYIYILGYVYLFVYYFPPLKIYLYSYLRCSISELSLLHRPWSQWSYELCYAGFPRNIVMQLHHLSCCS